MKHVLLFLFASGLAGAVPLAGAFSRLSPATKAYTALGLEFDAPKDGRVCAKLCSERDNEASRGFAQACQEAGFQTIRGSCCGTWCTGNVRRPVDGLSELGLRAEDFACRRDGDCVLHACGDCRWSLRLSLSRPALARIEQKLPAFCAARNEGCGDQKSGVRFSAVCRNSQCGYSEE